MCKPEAQHADDAASHVSSGNDSWWALQDSNLRPLPCESAPGDRQTYAGLSKPSQSQDITPPARSDFRPALAPFFPRVGPNWVQCLSSKYSALLSVRQVAQLLGVSTAIVYRLCEHGELEHVRVSNAVRIVPQDLATFLERRRRWLGGDSW
ncbi:MAG TPA: helix-turn-helix domain-containing protein [Myxococcales bacterium]